MSHIVLEENMVDGDYNLVRIHSGELKRVVIVTDRDKHIHIDNVDNNPNKIIIEVTDRT